VTVPHQPRTAVGARCVPASNYRYLSTDDLPNLPDLDLIAVERAVNGLPTTLTDEEAYQAGRLLNQYGYQPNAISVRTGMHPRRVQRWKERGWPEVRPDPLRGLRTGAA
jgi:hypothetical protein